MSLKSSGQPGVISISQEPHGSDTDGMIDNGIIYLLMFFAVLVVAMIFIYNTMP